MFKSLSSFTLKMNNGVTSTFLIEKKKNLCYFFCVKYDNLFLYRNIKFYITKISLYIATSFYYI